MISGKSSGQLSAPNSLNYSLKVKLIGSDENQIQCRLNALGIACHVCWVLLTRTTAYQRAGWMIRFLAPLVYRRVPYMGWAGARGSSVFQRGLGIVADHAQFINCLVELRAFCGQLFKLPVGELYPCPHLCFGAFFLVNEQPLPDIL